MKVSLLNLLRCPGCNGRLQMEAQAADEVVEGAIHCPSCDRVYAIAGGIPRFVSDDEYTKNFGLQWKRFRQTQLDSYSGKPISADRFRKYTGWSAEELKGKLVLDAGCGAGRFAEIALEMGARVVAIDFSQAVEAARENLRQKGDIEFVKADINALPFAPATFSYVYCLGVIHHTPDPTRSFNALASMIAPGGRLAVDAYPRLLRNAFASKYWIRPITRRLKPETTLRVFERLFPPLYSVSSTLSRIPRIGRYLKYALPVANYHGTFDLTQKQLRNWALLDTFDMWAPAYDQPQSRATMERWFADGGFRDVEVFRDGFLIGRGTKE